MRGEPDGRQAAEATERACLPPRRAGEAAVALFADGEALRHWILCIDEREKLRAATLRAPLVKGSHEQLMLNPLFRRVRDLSQEIARAEEYFAMTPLARLRLGVTYLQEQAAKDNLQARRERRRPHLMVAAE